MADVSQIIARLRLLRLNTMPPYTYDGDEGERSVDEYLAFFNDRINDSIFALDEYIKSLQGLLERV